MNEAIDLLNKHVFHHLLCICGARPPPRSRCSSTTGARPRRSCNRRRCRPSFSTDVRMRCRGSTLVHGAALGAPPLRCNHLSSRVRHRGPNVAKAPRASHPAQAAVKLLSLRGGRHSSLAARPASARTAVPSRKSRRRVIRAVGGESTISSVPQANVLDNVVVRFKGGGAVVAVASRLAEQSIVGDVMCSSTASTLGGRVSANAIGT